MSGESAKKIVYYKYILLSQIIWKFQKLLFHWILLIRNKKLAIPSGNLINENLEIQKRYDELYGNYSSCSKCPTCCCLGGINRFSYFDHYISGKEFNKDLFSPEELRSLIEKIFTKISKILNINISSKKTNSIDDIQEKCPELGNEGCNLPIGEKPIMCVDFICLRLIDDFTKKDLATFTRLNTQYFLFKNKCLWTFAKSVLKEK